MEIKTKEISNQDQLDLFDGSASKTKETDSFEQLWNGSRGRDYIKASGKNGKNVTLVFDHLDQEYHLLED